ncbi:DNA cytosine methyltransferase [Brevundimonas vesicularis]|uniref:DNA cytosine methyltransferase n=1 Tax=Brevundimonas vesicularis TaxID=41276 RepID=UPI00161E4D9F|nr:DNA cytosine methyltransferase [Brevundimonas vesicularis]
MYAAELFSGGGGLAVGLRDAGVRPVAAVEVDRYAADTFALNHPDVKLFDRDIRTVTGKDLLDASPTRRIDILAACPPCQGFSTLTSKYKRDDERNGLVAEVGRLAAEALPQAIMMENVAGLAGRGKPILDRLIAQLIDLGYVVRYEILQVADYGVPQRRKRLVLLAGLGFSIDMPKATHDRDGRNGLPRWRTVEDAILGHPAALDIQEAALLGGFAATNWHVVRRLGPENRARLAATEAGTHRSSLPIELRPKCHQNKPQGFGNSYGRMRWDQPSSTITAGCLSPSKGRFGHPEQLRTISLREAALLQTFPKDYKFPSGKIDGACSVIGNALPCLFAQQIANQVKRTIASVGAWLSTEHVHAH